MSQSEGNMKQFFGSESYSDATLKIIERENMNSSETVGNQSSSSLKPGENRKRKIDLGTENIQFFSTKPYDNILYCTLPVHRLVLVSRCDYFKNSFDKISPVTQRKEITLSVGKGEGTYAKLFVQSLYDEAILENMSAHQLLCVMKIADALLCHYIIDKTINLLASIPFQGFDECINIALFTKYSNISLAKVKTSTENLFIRCATYATDLFYPLERNMAVMSEYIETLPLKLLLAMLECEKRLAWHDNTVLYFLGLWLEFDLSRQTSNTIRLILSQVCYSALTPKFFVAFFKEKESFFKKWPGYQEWVKNVMTYHLVSPVTRFPENINQVKSIKYLMLKSESKNNIYTSEGTLFFYKGYQISPTILLTFDVNNTDYYEIGMNIHIANLTKFFNEEVCSKAILQFSIAATVYAESKDEEKFLNFSEVRKQQCCSFLFQYDKQHSVNRRYDKLGLIHKKRFKHQNPLRLVLAFKDKEQRWPDHFPAHLQKLTSDGMKINIAF